MKAVDYCVALLFVSILVCNTKAQQTKDNLPDERRVSGTQNDTEISTKKIARMLGDSLDRSPFSIAKTSIKEQISLSKYDFALLKIKVDLHAALHDVCPAKFTWFWDPSMIDTFSADPTGYLFWEFSCNPNDEELRTNVGMMVFAILMKHMSELHVSAHCIVIENPDPHAKEPKKVFITIDRDQDGKYLPAQVSVTKPSAPLERRRVLAGLFKELEDIEKKIDKSSGASDSDQAERKRLEQREDEIERVLFGSSKREILGLDRARAQETR